MAQGGGFASDREHGVLRQLTWHREGGQVITVPAHFNAKQREATLAAAEKAGLDRVELLQGAPSTCHLINMCYACV